MLLVGNELKITFFVHEAKRLTTHTWIMKKLYYAEFSLKVGCGQVWFCRHALELTPTGEAGEMRHCSSTFYSKRLKQIYFVAVKLHRWRNTRLCHTRVQTGKSSELVSHKLTVRWSFICNVPDSTVVLVPVHFLVTFRHLCGWSAGGHSQEGLLHWPQPAILCCRWKTAGSKGCPPQLQNISHHSESTLTTAEWASSLNTRWWIWTVDYS